MAGIVQLPFDGIEKLGLLVSVERRPRRKFPDPNEESAQPLLFLSRIVRLVLSLNGREELLEFVGNLLSEGNGLTSVEPRNYHNIDRMFRNSGWSHRTQGQATATVEV